MTISRKAIQISILAALSLISMTAYAQKSVDQNGPGATNPASAKVRLKLVDGSSIEVDEVSESEQGIWYRRGGMNHLITRDRLKAIERGASKPKPELQIAKVVVTDDRQTKSDSQETNSADGPVWIYLVGGARVEADSVTESAAGAWYRRGTDRKSTRLNSSHVTTSRMPSSA